MSEADGFPDWPRRNCLKISYLNLVLVTGWLPIVAPQELFENELPAPGSGHRMASRVVPQELFENPLP